MSRFVRELKKHHNEKLQYNYDFEKIEKELGLRKKTVIDKSIITFKRAIVLTMIVFLSLISVSVIAYFDYYNDVPEGETGYYEKIFEKVGSYTDSYIDSAVYTEVFPNNAKIIFYFGIGKNGKNPVFVIHIFPNSLKDIYKIKINGEENVIDYNNPPKDDMNWRVIFLPSTDKVDINFEYTSSNNKTFLSDYQINIEKYIKYLIG